MISIKEAEFIHAVLIQNFGGTSGVRDHALLSSALSRPFQTFDGKELYPSEVYKAAALLESILINHPFVDGNKRTGYTLMCVYLLRSGIDLTASEDAKYELVIGVASGKYKHQQIVEWLGNNSVEI